MDTRSRIERRHLALRAARDCFYARSFVEADTPLLAPAPGTEPHIDPLAVDVRTSLASEQTQKRYLITSPELALKRVVAAGVPRVFQLGHVFRDGERGARHLPEFTMLEWYRGPGTLDDVLADTLAVIRAVAKAIGNTGPVDVEGEVVSVSCAEAFGRFAGIDLDAALDNGDLVQRVRAKEDAATGSFVRSFDDAFFFVMDRYVEPSINDGRLWVVEKWPASMAVLARLDDDRRYARRFELYGAGLELCNAFDELTDPVEQRARFVADNALRAAAAKAEVPLDEDFLAALSSMPSPSAGNALGFDRLLMLLTGGTIDDVSGLVWR